MVNPNTNVKEIRTIFGNIDEEYNIEDRLNRYKSLTPELIELAKSNGLTNIEDITKALFVADYIVTSSEIPQGTNDEKRYLSIIKTFIIGKERNDSSDLLMRTYYVAYKIASTIRSKDLFMAGRGLQRDPSLIRINDAYIYPYLKVVAEKLGVSSCSWELGILSAALKRKLPHVEIEKFIDCPSYNDYSKITPVIWQMLKSYSNVQKVDLNLNVTIPNIQTSKSALIINSSFPELISFYNIPSCSKDLRGRTKNILTLLEKIGESSGKNFVFAKARILNSMDFIFLVRDPNTKGRPLFVMKSPVNEINLTQLLPILSLRGLEDTGWKLTETETIEKEVTVTEQPVITTTSSPSQTVNKDQGFLSKVISSIKGIFGKKQKPSTEKTKIRKTKPKPKIRKKILKETKKKIYLPNYLAEALTVEAVGDLALYEQFDTLREGNYSLTAIFSSSYENNRTKFYLDDLMGKANEITQTINTLTHVVSECASLFFNETNLQFILEELFFITEKGYKFIININGNQSIMTGTEATSIIDDIADWKHRSKEDKSLQRRSLTMRVNQLLKALNYTPFDEASKRIFAQNFDFTDAKIEEIQQVIN